MKKLAIILLFLAGPVCSVAQVVTPEQEQKIRDAFNTTNRIWSFGSDLLKEVAENYKDAIDKCSDAFTVLDVLNKVSEARDYEAFETIILAIEAKIISAYFEDMFPNLVSSLNWASKAKILMELLIDFVINPALMSNEIDQYIARRKILLEPEDAIAGIRSWGNIKQQLLQEFRKQYGDLPFREIKPSGLVLLPRWEKNFDDFVTGWFEMKYQEYNLRQYQERARREAPVRRRELEERVDILEYLLEQQMKAIQVIVITPKEAELKINESVAFTVEAVTRGGERMNVTQGALSNPVFHAFTPGIFTIMAEYGGKSAIARITVEADQPAGPGTDNDPDINQLMEQADCSEYPNTQPFWDPGLKEVYCDCKPGYSWLPDFSGCEETMKLLLAQADCSGYPNTRPVWDQASSQIICDCLPGYIWDDNYIQCIPVAIAQLSNADCSGYPNTRPVWDPGRQEVFCDCLPGYKWKDDMTGCDQVTATMITDASCAHLPNTRPVYDPSHDMMVCDCLPGFVWNSSFTECVPERKKPSVDINALMDLITMMIGQDNPYHPGNMVPGGTPGGEQPVVHQSRCNDMQRAGSNKPEVHQIDLGQTSGTFRFDYQTYTVKDQIIITQGGRTIFNSGCVGESKSVTVAFSGFTSIIEVRVNPNCAGSNDTAWNFTVHCPSY